MDRKIKFCSIVRWLQVLYQQRRYSKMGIILEDLASIRRVYPLPTKLFHRNTFDYLHEFINLACSAWILLIASWDKYKIHSRMHWGHLMGHSFMYIVVQHSPFGVVEYSYVHELVPSSTDPNPFSHGVLFIYPIWSDVYFTVNDTVWDIASYLYSHYWSSSMHYCWCFL